MRAICRGAAIAITAIVATTATGAGRGVVIAQASANSPVATALKPYVVEFYYKVKWGHFDEFHDLYLKNHYPILKRLQRDGRILSMSAAYPRNHAGESSRWDMRFTIVYRDILAEQEETSEALIKEIYPDQATFTKEEQRRFELLLEHMDVPVRVDDLTQWK
ncbi:MAG: hypothetical protein ABIQ52_12180 [Vicinamibacterales bacterium]